MPYESILTFSRTRELWQQDLIRRIVTQAEVSAADIHDSITILKAYHELISTDDAPTPVPLGGEHVPHHSETAPPTTVNSLGDVQHTNRLAAGQTLRFATDGITVVYGDNGSGKSGYCRLAKKLCRVRAGGEEDILGNAFSATASPPAEASVSYSIGCGEPQTFTWQDGMNGPEELSRISVFDAKTAPIYADKKNEVEFLPQGLDILPRLGEVCRDIAGRIGAEIAVVEGRVRSPFPILPHRSDAASVIAKLSSIARPETLPTVESLEEITRWEDSFAQTLDETEKALACDPKNLANGCERQKNMVKRLAAEVDTIEKVLGEAAVVEVKAKVEIAQGARKAADLAAEETFTDEPLGHIGSDPWRSMFRFAKEYCALVYPEETFPAVDEGKVCLFCQQPLRDNSPERLTRFVAFINNKAQAEAQRLEGEVQATFNNVNSFVLRPPAEIREMLGGLEDLDPESKDVVTMVTTFLESLPTRRQVLIEAIVGRESFDSIPAVQPSPKEVLEGAAGRLEVLVKKYNNDQDEEQRNRLVAERDNLIARKCLSSEAVRESVLNRREDLILLGRLKACKASCDTSSISRKNSELRQEFFTADFSERLGGELLLFGLDHLPLRVADESRGGTSHVGVELRATRRVQNMNILSDGEFRALALACFLTEVGGIPGHSGIIVDDPVSSLDHLRTRRVADRLIVEAGRRQVIVLTHDLVFFHELREAAATRSVPFISHWVRPTSAGCGTVADGEEPWQAKKVRQRLHVLDTKLAELRRIDDQAGEEYRGAVGDFCTDLRETWERLVEECLLNEVVGRFQDGVKTQSLKGVMVEDADYRTVFFGMKRASEHSGHDRAIGRRRGALPTPEELHGEVEGLRTYSASLRGRNTRLQEERRVLERPPVGNVL